MLLSAAMGPAAAPPARRLGSAAAVSSGSQGLSKPPRGAAAPVAGPGEPTGSFRARLAEQTAATTASQGRAEQAVPQRRPAEAPESGPPKTSKPALLLERRARPDETAQAAQSEDAARRRAADAAGAEGSSVPVPSPAVVPPRPPERRPAASPPEQDPAAGEPPADQSPAAAPTTPAAAVAVLGAAAELVGLWVGKHSGVHSILQFGGLEFLGSASGPGSGGPGTDLTTGSEPAVQGSLGEQTLSVGDDPLPAATEPGGEAGEPSRPTKRNADSVPRETILPPDIPSYKAHGIFPEVRAALRPDTHAAVENTSTPADPGEQPLSPSFYGDKTIGSDLVADSVSRDPQKFPQPPDVPKAPGHTDSSAPDSESAEAPEGAGKGRTDRTQKSAQRAAGSGFAGARVEGGLAAERSPDARLQQSPAEVPAAAGTPQSPAAGDGGKAVAVVMDLGAGSAPSAATEPTPTPDPDHTAGRRFSAAGSTAEGAAEPAGRSHPELPRAAFGLRLEVAETAQPFHLSDQTAFNLPNRGVSSSSSADQRPVSGVAGGQPNGAPRTGSQGQNGEDRASDLGRADATDRARPDGALLRSADPRSTVEPGAARQDPGQSGGDSGRQAATGGPYSVTHSTSGAFDASPVRSNAAPVSPPPGSPPEVGGRFVRGASIEAGAAEVQRINVLLQDDQLGRIALRVVDRAGLIHAVLKTDGARAAQLISESLPALLESLSQRGLLASWTSGQGAGQSQPFDLRQGQPRRQRGGPPGGAGGRRPARQAGKVFAVEAS